MNLRLEPTLKDISREERFVCLKSENAKEDKFRKLFYFVFRRNEHYVHRNDGKSFRCHLHVGLRRIVSEGAGVNIYCRELAARAETVEIGRTVCSGGIYLNKMGTPIEQTLTFTVATHGDSIHILYTKY